MLMIISPAKRLDFESPLPKSATQPPRFLEKSQMLIENLRRLDGEALGSLMKLSDKLVALNRERYQSWRGQGGRPAIHAFQGDVYRALDVSSLNATSLARAEERLLILSGLYGLLRAGDEIEAHRLEMGTPLKLPEGKGLYRFWREEVSAALAEHCQSSGSRSLLNLASKEYAEVVDWSMLPVPVIEPRFLEQRGEKLKVIAIHAKRARGMMARFVLEEEIEEPAQLSTFGEGGYAYAPELSEEGKPCFVR